MPEQGGIFVFGESGLCFVDTVLKNPMPPIWAASGFGESPQVPFGLNPLEPC